MNTLDRPIIDRVRLVRPEHDALTLAPSTDQLWRWEGTQMTNDSRGMVWDDAPAPVAGDTIACRDLRPLDRWQARYVEGALYVEVPCTVWGDYVGNTLYASNFRVLQAEYPDTFIVSEDSMGAQSLYLNIDTPVDADLLRRLIALRDEYACLDEMDYSQYEHDLGQEAWDQYLWMDVRGDLDDAGLDTFWVKESHVRALFYEHTYGVINEYPHGEGDCATSVVFPGYKQTVSYLIDRLRSTS